MFEKRNDLLKFLAVVETGKIQFAAEKMNTTQSALSRVITKLEESFGGQLFERLPTGVRLTPFGSKILEQVQHIEREIEMAETEIAANISGQSGELRMTTGPMWLRSYFPEVIKKFQKQYPGITIQIKTKSYSEGVEDLIDGNSDMHCGGFDNDDPLPQFIRRKHITTMQLGVMANAAHPIFDKKNPTYSDLVDYPWITHSMDSRQTAVNSNPAFTSILDELFEKCGKRVSTIVRCDMTGLFLIGTGPYLAYGAINFASRFAGQRLRQVPLEFTPKSFDAGVVARRSLESTSAFQYLTSLLEAEIKLYL